MAEEKRNWLYAFWTKAAAFFLAAALAPVMLFYAGCASRIFTAAISAAAPCRMPCPRTCAAGTMWRRC